MNGDHDFMNNPSRRIDMRYPSPNLIAIAALVAMVALLVVIQPKAQALAQETLDNPARDPLDASTDVFAEEGKDLADPLGRGRGSNLLDRKKPGADVFETGADADPFADGGPGAGPRRPGSELRDPFAPQQDAQANPLAPRQQLRNQPSSFSKQLLRASQAAYERSMADFRTGKVTDPEVVYRWSMRYMKTERSISQDPSVAVKGHLRRMEELAQLVAKAKATEDTELRTMAAEYYRAEAESLLDGANPDKVAESPADAAIKVAEAYLTAVLKGDTDAASKLAAPGSLAASKQLMESFKDLVPVESDGSPISFNAVQVSGRGEQITATGQIQLVGKGPNDHLSGPFSIDLKQTNSRFRVTNFAIFSPRYAPSRNSLLSKSSQSSFPSSAPNTAPKATKVFSLKHAKAADLSQTISQLLELDNSELRVAVDARTNRVLVHGTREKMEDVEALIQELDVPSAVKEVLPSIEPGAPSDAATDRVPAQESLPSPARP
jgi:hypothetical protein